MHKGISAMRTFSVPLLIALIALLLGACSSQPTSSPETVVEQYLTALVAGDNLSAVNLSCAAWEASANAEGAAFEGVEVELGDVACSTAEQAADGATVNCQGQILFSYAGGETESIDLSLRSYLVSQEGGEWRMCGYK